jgi:hypothetical protein
MSANDQRIFDILGQVKKLAREYFALTGRPLGVTGEIAEYEAARLLSLSLVPARTPGIDAIRLSDGSFLQIKGRCVRRDRNHDSQRVGRIDVTKSFGAVLLVLMDEEYEVFEMHEASRKAVLAALAKPGSRARNERGSLGVGKFKQISRCSWIHAGDRLPCFRE